MSAFAEVRYKHEINLGQKHRPPLLCACVPAYKPDPRLSELVASLLREPLFAAVVVIDDASGPEYRATFDALAALGCTVLRHQANQGVGGATKSGFEHILLHYPDAAGAITFDADCQHLAADIAKVAAAFRRSPDSFVIGVREFHDPGIAIPWRSRFGNRLTELIFAGFTGVKLRDTQSGLRAYPLPMLARCLKIKRNRYEFVFEALLNSVQNCAVIQVPISTVYEQENRCSHFNPVLDSIRIYLVFLRFAAVSLICAGTDFLIFALLLLVVEWHWALAAARIASVSLNFFLAKSRVFSDSAKGRVWSEAWKFVLLAAALFSGSFYGIRLLTEFCRWHELAAKIVVEPILFFASFFIQRWVIFPLRRNHGGARDE